VKWFCLIPFPLTHSLSTMDPRDAEWGEAVVALEDAVCFYFIYLTCFSSIISFLRVIYRLIQRHCAQIYFGVSSFVGLVCQKLRYIHSEYYSNCFIPLTNRWYARRYAWWKRRTTWSWRSQRPWPTKRRSGTFLKILTVRSLVILVNFVGCCSLCVL